MLALTIDFLNVLLAALLVGTMFGVGLFLNPARLDATSYVVVQQQAIRTLNTVLPTLGGATILITIAAATLGREDGVRLWLLIMVVVCLVASGLITRFLNQPINAIVITWRSDTPPSDWGQLRDAWWRWHLVRLTMGLGGLTLLIAATLKRV